MVGAGNRSYHQLIITQSSPKSPLHPLKAAKVCGGRHLSGSVLKAFLSEEIYIHVAYVLNCHRYLKQKTDGR